MTSQQPNTPKKTIAHIIVDWWKPFFSVLGFLVVLITILIFLIGDNILSSKSDVRVLKIDTLRTRNILMSGISVFNRGGEDAIDVIIKLNYTSEILDYNCDDKRFVYKINCEKSQDHKTLKVTLDRVAHQNDSMYNLDQGGVISVSLNDGDGVLNVDCTNPSGLCKDTIYKRSFYDQILLGCGTLLLIIFLVQNGAPALRLLLRIKI